jgi:hypothetical protein
MCRQIIDPRTATSTLSANLQAGRREEPTYEERGGNKRVEYNDRVICHMVADFHQWHCGNDLPNTRAAMHVPQHRLCFCAAMTTTDFGVSHLDTELQPAQLRNVQQHRRVTDWKRLQKSAQTHEHRNRARARHRGL